jgi:hypothetical protein
MKDLSHFPKTDIRFWQKGVSRQRYTVNGRVRKIASNPATIHRRSNSESTLFISGTAPTPHTCRPTMLDSISITGKNIVSLFSRI